MKKLIFTVLTLFAFSADFFAQNKILPDEIMQELYTNGSIRKTYMNEDNVKLVLTPDTPLCHDAASDWNSEIEPNTISENLFLIKKADLIAKSKNPENTDTSLNKVSEILRAISRMKGMQYYSEGNKKFETLYHQAYVCKSVDEYKTVLPDKTEGPADGLKLFCFLEDNTFGKYVYSLNYKQHEKEISFSMNNAEPWSYFFVTVIKKGNLKINMVVIDNEDSYIVYMILRAKNVNVPFFSGKLQKSLSNRIDAIYKWFTFQF